MTNGFAVPNSVTIYPRDRAASPIYLYTTL